MSTNTINTISESNIPQPLTVEEINNNISGVLATISVERAGDYAAKALSLDLSQRPEALAERPNFYDALAQPGLSVIAEIKRASPSKGAIAALDPVETAKAYERGGAKAISVLTEHRHFSGQLEDLELVANISKLPLLRKDFTVHPLQLFEAAYSGASCILLIVAVMQEKTADYITLAKSLGLDALVEVHNEEELSIALSSKADIIGVNNRDLRSLEIDLNNAPKLISIARNQGYSGLLVAESGYNSPTELVALKGLADAVLIGSSIAASDNLEEAVKQLSA